MHDAAVLVSPEGTLAVVLLDFQTDSEGKQVTVGGERRGLLR